MNTKSGNMQSAINENSTIHTPFIQTYFHGTKAQLHLGAHIQPGFQSNFGDQNTAPYIFLTATLDAAIWGAELAQGQGPQRIYLVEATGPIENDPDLTDRKFPGNPTMSYRSKHPFKIVGEVTSWQPHPQAQVQAMQEALARLHQQGIRSLNDQ